MAHFHDNDGYFVAPAPMYESYKKVFEDALDSHDRQWLTNISLIQVNR
jgi:hypothetical protein